MKRYFLIGLVLIFLSGLSSSCRAVSGKSVEVTKPRRHFFPYDPAKHKKAKRTRIVKMKG